MVIINARANTVLLDSKTGDFSDTDRRRVQSACVDEHGPRVTSRQNKATADASLTT